MSENPEWNDPSTTPDELNRRFDWFSVDVLCYSPKEKEHTVGWFDYRQMKWIFLVRETRKEWKWRYFTDADKYKPQRRIRAPDSDIKENEQNDF